MSKGSNLRINDILAAPDFTQAVVLAANTGAVFDTPAGMGFVSFSMDTNFWAKYGSTSASIPTTSSTAGTTNSELNPTVRNIGSTASCTGISLISGSSCVGSLNWYKPA